MGCMFNKCSSLREINLYNFDMQNVTNMKEMLCEFSLLHELNLSKFNTKKVTNMKGMFSFCNYLLELDLSSFNTENVNNMEKMFYMIVLLYLKSIHIIFYYRKCRKLCLYVW